MELGNNLFRKMGPIERNELLKAYNTYLSNEVFYALQEDLVPDDSLIGQSQYFELNMEKLYKGFVDLNIRIKIYLYERLATDLLVTYNTIIARNKDIVQNFIDIESSI